MQPIFYSAATLLLALSTDFAIARSQNLGALVVTSTEQNLTLRFPFPELVSPQASDALLCGPNTLPAATQIILVSPARTTQTIQANIVSATCYELKNLQFSSAGAYTLKTDRTEFVLTISNQPSLKDVSLFSKRNAEDSQGVLQFEGQTLTTKTTQSILCLGGTKKVINVSLWMPDMGHGSSPVTLTPRADGCLAITDMDFFMTGPWDVRVSLADNSKLTFGVNIQ